MKKYICIGGNVRSKTDADIHYISPHRLAELYKVNPDECFFASNINDNTLQGLRLKDFVILRPKNNGNYV